jgi:hypothetical protein
MQGRFTAWYACAAVFFLFLGGCFGGGGGGQSGNKRNGSNGPPTISGSPPPEAMMKHDYEFVPSASDPDGDKLRFSIAQKPPWARFDEKTGRLHGMPLAQDVGEHVDIRISVSDGRETAMLPAFTVRVYQSGDESATLSWAPPTENADGSALTDLAGYRIYFGNRRDELHRVVHVDNPGLTRFVVEYLYPETWFFTMTSVKRNGVESQRPRPVRKRIA